MEINKFAGPITPNYIHYHKCVEIMKIMDGLTYSDATGILEKIFSKLSQSCVLIAPKAEENASKESDT